MDHSLTLEQHGTQEVGRGSVEQSRFESLLSDLLSKKTDYSKEQVLELIREKRTKVGAGYLTDQGALFLVASDLKVSLKYDPSPPRTKLSELNSERRGIAVVARVLSLGMPRRFESNSRQGFLMKVVLYDESKKISVSTVWDYKIGLRLVSAAAPGTAIKVSNCYTKAGIDGTQSLNIPDSSEVTILEEGNPIVKSIPVPNELAVDIDKLQNHLGSGLLIVGGVVAEPVRRQEFTRTKDSLQKHFLSFSLKSRESESNAVRVVLWGNSNPHIEKLTVGEEATLAGVRARSNSFQGSDQIELHGDDSTIALEKWGATREWLNQEMNQLEKQFTETETIGSKSIPSTLPLIARVLSIGANSGREKYDNAAHLLLVDSTKRRISTTALDEAASDAGALQIDDVVLCKPDTFDEIGLRVVCKKKGSIARLKPERKDIPRSDSLICRIEKFEPGTVVSLDAMTLAETVAREIQTKEGSLVRRTEVSLADPSGEIMLYAWRSLSKSLEGLGPGIRVWIKAAEVQSHESKKFLLLKNYSRIEKKEEEN